MFQLGFKIVLICFIFKLFWMTCKKILTINSCKLIGNFFKKSIDSKIACFIRFNKTFEQL
jgi:hypothetical protein